MTSTLLALALALALLPRAHAADEVILPPGDGPGNPPYSDEDVAPPPPVPAGSALEGEASPAGGPVAPPAPPRTLEEVWADQGPAAVLEEAIERRVRGDFASAEARLAWLGAHHPSGAVDYQRAVTAELQERYEAALDGYGRVLAQHPDEAVAVDAAFRRALVLEDLGRHREATVEVKRLERAGTWSAADRLSLELARGVAELGQGRQRRGLRRLDRALASLEGSQDLSWMQARARAALARHLLAEAADIPMTNGRKAGRNLEARAAAIAAAERQIIAVANLGEPEYALVGLELLGDGYIALHDDLVALPPPPELSPEQAAIYRDSLAEKAGVLARKAWRYYDQGVDLAARTQWQGAISGRLQARRDAVGLDGPATH